MLCLSNFFPATNIPSPARTYIALSQFRCKCGEDDLLGGISAIARCMFLELDVSFATPAILVMSPDDISVYLSYGLIIVVTCLFIYILHNLYYQNTKLFCVKIENFIFFSHLLN